MVLANSSKFTLSEIFIFLVCICRILALASSVGDGNSIFLSKRPERNNAGSNTSTRFVAPITLISSIEENPSS
uniref:Putative secreted protein n=1 Tax=Panstrongylus lignarius TaxID=156445 RepID=A0A224XU11_9HEMI